MKPIALPSIASCLRITAFSCALTALPLISSAADTFKISDDDGTYKTITVKSQEECAKLCEIDNSICRGSMLFEDFTIIKGEVTSSKQCRLNNGLSEKSPFKIAAPAPLNLKRALKDLNAYRAKSGLKPLKLNDALSRASDIHAKDLAKHGIAAHEGTDGSTHGERVQRQGYYFSTAAENVATGQKSWKAVFQAWKDSPGHNANLLADGVTDFGIALVFEPTTEFATYWAMVVAAPLPSFAHPEAAMTVKQKALLEAGHIAAD